MDNLELRAVSAPWWGGVEFLIRERNGNTISYGEDIVMQTHEGGVNEIVRPTFRLSLDNAQALIDDLWKCGLRPTEGAGSAGALAATQKHLEDMRRIAFDLLGKDHD